MRTIEKILKYRPYTKYEIESLRKMGLYNGTGTDEINFDKIIDDLIDLLIDSKTYDKEKAFQLRKDIEQLVIRHDMDTHHKIGFKLSNKRLAKGIFKLLHHFSYWYRVIAMVGVYKAVSGSTARKNYKKTYINN